LNSHEYRQHLFPFHAGKSICQIIEITNISDISRSKGTTAPSPHRDLLFANWRRLLPARMNTLIMKSPTPSRANVPGVGTGVMSRMAAGIMMPVGA
jgi:hypothetical protein